MNEHSPALEEASKWTVGLGMLTLALFPLSIPFLVLLGVAAVPLLLLPLAGALALAVIAAPFALAWWGGRAAIRALRSPEQPERERSGDRARVGIPTAGRQGSS